MKKLIFYTLITLAFCVGLAVSPVAAQTNDFAQNDDNVPGQRPRLLQELGLTRQQLQQIRRINQERQSVVKAAQENLRLANVALDEAVYADAPNEAMIQQRVKAVQSAQATVIDRRTHYEYEVRKLLNPDQIGKFRDLRQQFTKRLQPAVAAPLPKQNKTNRIIRPRRNRPV